MKEQLKCQLRWPISDAGCSFSVFALIWWPVFAVLRWLDAGRNIAENQA
jgi:hypothetical protein